MKLNEITQHLNSGLDARMLVKAVTGLTDADLIGADDIELSPAQKTQLDGFIAQRLNHRPVAKIIGRKEFYGRIFFVNDDVLDPRPDSEVLIDAVLAYARDKQNLKILELGVGSGCLILSLLSELKNARGMATDISDKALCVAKRNANALALSNRIELRNSNWFESVDGTFDIIISNPPYIDSKIINNLQKEVSRYDPILALDGGLEGVLPYKKILPQIRNYLKPNGFVAMEHGYDHCGRIADLMDECGLTQIRQHKDLAGHDRVLTAIHK
jgi:release factor glutamine methyltransferase